ncbi:MAG: hypothetical protein OCD76_16305 [Reichenbachiella sp.]
MYRITFLVSFLLLCINTFSQSQSNSYKIKKSKGFLTDRCKDYNTLIKSFPDDIRYGVFIDGRTIYFTFPSIEHFEQLFDKNSDGIAIDIIQNNQYSCDTKSNLSKKWPNRGYMLAPMYKKQLEENLKLDILKNVVVEYGSLPDQFNPNDIECNLLSLQKKALCDYSIISNMKFENWDLLETGLYWDTIPEKIGTSDFQFFYKTLEFTIPFEKDKIEYKEADIKPLYDSLKITGYQINEISIDAYSSIEGSIERNVTLQKGRAQSIINAFQAYQINEIETTISFNENWTQFAKDIKGTEFEYLLKYSKEKIRSELTKNKDFLNSLEPTLSKQRKGMIKLTLQKRISTYEDSPEQLKSTFQQSLSDQDLSQAIFLQQMIFNRIRSDKLPDEFINQLEIPKDSKYGPLFNNIILFDLERFNTDVLQTIKEFEFLETFTPNSSKIKYNLLALKIKSWSEGNTLGYNRNSIAILLDEIDKSEISKSLLFRLKINYNLILIQYLTYEKKFNEKRKLVKELYYQYRNLNLSDTDVYNLAKFLVFYSEFKLAEEVLYSKVVSENVSEELLFYYLELTFAKEKPIKHSAYMKVIQKAIDLNQNRYCNLFLPKSQGGHTFQLLENDLLKQIYCENCTNKLVN